MRLALGLGLPTVGGTGLPSWLPTADSTTPTIFADFTTEATTNHYWYNGVQYANFAALLAALGGTFSRTSTAYYTNSSGLLASAASGVQRFDHNPTTPFAAIGTELEGSRTNSLLQSNSFSTTPWILQNSTILQDATGPDGLTSAWTLTASSTLSTGSVLQQSIALAAGSTLSIYTEAGTTGWVYIAANNANGSVGTFFNLSTGALGSNNVALVSAPDITFTNPTIKDVGGGIYRISATIASADATLIRFGIADADASRSITSGKTAIFYGGQGESSSSFASSYIPTTTTSATRAEDGLTRTRTSPTIITKKFKAITPAGIGASSPQTLWQIDDGTASNRIRVYRDVTAKHVFVNVTSGGVDQASLDMGAVADSTEFSLAFRAQGNDFAASLGGGAVVSDSAGTMPSGMVNERWGADSAGDEWYGHYEVDAEWTGLAATNATLQSLAT